MGRAGNPLHPTAWRNRRSCALSQSAPYETGGGIWECRWRQVYHCSTSVGANRPTTLRRGHDAIQSGGVKVPQHEFLQAHADLLRRDEWVLDGFGSAALSWERFAAADTLVYVDLPLLIHYTWVTQRLIKGLFTDPKGWPRGSPLWSSSLSSYRVIPLCHRNLTPKYRQFVAEAAASKRIHHLRSVAQIHSFLEAVRRELGTTA